MRLLFALIISLTFQLLTFATSAWSVDNALYERFLNVTSIKKDWEEVVTGTPPIKKCNLPQATLQKLVDLQWDLAKGDKEFHNAFTPELMKESIAFMEGPVGKKWTANNELFLSERATGKKQTAMNFPTFMRSLSPEEVQQIDTARVKYLMETRYRTFGKLAQNLNDNNGRLTKMILDKDPSMVAKLSEKMKKELDRVGSTPLQPKDIELLRQTKEIVSGC